MRIKWIRQCLLKKRGLLVEHCPAHNVSCLESPLSPARRTLVMRQHFEVHPVTCSHHSVHKTRVKEPSERFIVHQTSDRCFVSTKDCQQTRPVSTRNCIRRAASHTHRRSPC